MPKRQPFHALILVLASIKHPPKGFNDHLNVVHDLGLEEGLGSVIHDLVAQLGLGNVLTELLDASALGRRSVLVNNLD